MGFTVFQTEARFIDRDQGSAEKKIVFGLWALGKHIGAHGGLVLLQCTCTGVLK
jgi:hypothetical protein